MDDLHSSFSFSLVKVFADSRLLSGAVEKSAKYPTLHPAEIGSGALEQGC